MNPHEANDIFQELERLLVETGFSWVVENLEVELDRGVQELQELPRYQEPSADGHSVPRRHEKVMSFRPPNEIERLTKMLDEVERCLILPLKIANDLPRTLSPDGVPLTAIEVVDTQTNNTVFRVVQEGLVASEHTASLEAAIVAIRGRINAT